MHEGSELVCEMKAFAGVSSSGQGFSHGKKNYCKISLFGISGAKSNKWQNYTSFPYIYKIC